MDMESYPDYHMDVITSLSWTHCSAVTNLILIKEIFIETRKLKIIFRNHTQILRTIRPGNAQVNDKKASGNILQASMC